MPRTLPRLSRKQAGFSLIDVLLAMGVVILISGITLTGIRRTNESNQAKAVGEQMKLVGTALNTYVSLRYDTLVAHNPGADDVGDPGTAADPGPRTCVATTATLKMCTITSETLRRNGLLPNSFSGFNAFGSTYQYRIRVDTAGTTPLVDGLVWTDQAYTLEGEERYDLLGQAMMVAGADSGMTRSTLTRVEGFNGAWSEENMGVSRLGVLAYRVGYNTFGYAAYLRLNGGTMMGDIDMGANDIFNIGTMKATNVAAINVVLPQNNAALRFSNGNVVTDGSTLAAPAASDPNIGVTGTAGGPALVLRSDEPIQMLRATDGTRADVRMDDLEAMNITANNATLSGNISAQGTITTTNQIRGNTVVAGPGGANNNTWIGGDASGGGIYFNTNSTGGAGSAIGFKLDNSTSTISMAGATLAVTGTIRSAGTSGTQGIMQADRRLELTNAGVSIQDLGGAPVPGATGCTVGVIARSSVGDLVQCANDGGTPRWRTMGMTAASITTQTGAQTCTGAGSAAGNAVTISCPAGYLVISGGYSYASGAQRAAPQSNYRSSATSWVVQAGPTQAYTGTESTQTCWNTYAICAR